MIIKTYKFRPQQWSKHSSKYRRYLRNVKQYRDNINLNWNVRQWHPNFIFRCGGHLHYLADHAPDPIKKKWKPAFMKFIQRHRKF